MAACPSRPLVVAGRDRWGVIHLLHDDNNPITHLLVSRTSFPFSAGAGRPGVCGSSGRGRWGMGLGLVGSGPLAGRPPVGGERTSGEIRGTLRPWHVLDQAVRSVALPRLPSSRPC